MKKHIAIIGAGIGGLTLAKTLQHKAHIKVFDKARGMGGRMSTRYADPYFFDHGTQYFTARHTDFRAFISPLLEKAVIAEWKGPVAHLKPDAAALLHDQQEPYYVGAPHMNSLCKYMAEGMEVITGCEIAPLQGAHAPWHLQDMQGRSLGTFDWVISTAPPVQSHRLMAGHFSTASTLQGCFALMLGFNQPWHEKWIAAECSDSAVRWIGINSSKPGRNEQATSVVVHADNLWSEQHMEDNPAEVQAALASAFNALTGWNAQTAAYQSLHRWRYALNPDKSKIPHYTDAQKGLACTGDWQSPSRIEDVWLQARALGQDILKSLQ